MKTVVQIGAWVFALGLQVSLIQVAAAEGDATAGREKAETCLGCHAAVNMENTYPMYRVPKVAGQHAEYIEAALKAYREKQRSHKTMQANASDLSDQDIADIAAYFSGALN